MKRSSRKIIALVMTAVYLLIMLAPLAPAALHSKVIAHALTGECSGDCRTCGCAPERSATRACCCWQKKLATKETAAATAGSSCNKTENLASAKTADCCKKLNRHTDHNDHALPEAAGNSSSPATDRPLPVISACPCGSAKHLALPGMENIQHYPFMYVATIPAPSPQPYLPLPPNRLISRNVAPPDPPPESPINS